MNNGMKAVLTLVDVLIEIILHMTLKDVRTFALLAGGLWLVPGFLYGLSGSGATRGV